MTPESVRYGVRPRRPRDCVPCVGLGPCHPFPDRSDGASLSRSEALSTFVTVTGPDLAAQRRS
jgi:hypothetical protein